MATATTVHDKKSVIQKQINALRAQMVALDQERIHGLRLKLAAAREVVRDLERQLEGITGKPLLAQPKARRRRLPAILDEALKDQLIKVLAAFGKEGMNAKQMAEKVHQHPLRVRKFLSENPKLLKRVGTGPRTRFFLP